MQSIKRFFTTPVILVVLATIFGFAFADLVLFSGCDDGIDIAFCQKMGIVNVFNTVPLFLIWVTLAILFTGLATAIGIISLKSILEMRREYKIAGKDIAAIFILTLAMGVAGMGFIFKLKDFSNSAQHFYVWPVSPLKNQDVKLFVIFAYNTAMSALGVAGMIVTGIVASRETAKKITPETVLDYFKLKRRLTNLLLMSGVVLSSGVIIVYLLYVIVSSINVQHSKMFDPDCAILFGLLFTLFVSASYMPAKFLLNGLGRAIKSSYIGEPPLQLEPDLKKWFDNKAAVEKYLELEVTATSATLQLMPILAPILTSVIPHLFRH